MCIYSVILSHLVFFFLFWHLSFITGPIVKGSAPIPPEREHSSGLESPKKRTSKLLPSFKIPAFKKTKGSEEAKFCGLCVSIPKWPGCVCLFYSIISRSASPSQQVWSAPVRWRWSPAGLETSSVKWPHHLLCAVLYRWWVHKADTAAQKPNCCYVLRPNQINQISCLWFDSSN